MKQLTNKEYRKWLTDLKLKIRQRQIKATITVNIELLQFYWELGQEIIQQQTTRKWGDGFLTQLSKDLMIEFPNMKGFSKSNLKYIRQWYLFYSQNQLITKQPISQLSIPISQQPVDRIEKPYVVIELKRGDFNPEYAGKMNFYCSAVDDLLKQSNDQPTIGLILCEYKNKIFAEYSLKDIQKPIGVSEYELTRALPENLKSSLPSVEEIEAELGNNNYGK